MDKSWVHMHPCTKEFDDGLKAFIEHVFAYEFVCASKVKCLCIDNKNMNDVNKEILYEHLICRKMMSNYKVWHLHGEKFEKTPTPETTIDTIDGECGECSDGGDHDYIIDMLRDRFERPVIDEDTDGVAKETDGVSSDGTATQFNKLVEELKVPLYPGCKNYTKLSFLFKLWHLKFLDGIRNKIFTSLLDLLRRHFLRDVLCQKISRIARRLFRYGFGSYACPNDCMLFWKENSKLEQYTICGTSKYIKESGITKKKSPTKILRHFPLIPRLQRLYMSSKVVVDMRWHEDNCTKDGIMRHPTDTPAWKYIDEKYLIFAADPRSVRLGLASDGFNPFETMSFMHSTWPVVIIPYNLPRWLYMKQPHMILSLLISGPKSPGNNIDVYMRPLIDELKEF